MAMPLAATTVRQTRGRASQAVAGAASSCTAPTSHIPCASRARVGGAMLETFSPGIPTMDSGYGPYATSSTAPVSPAAASRPGRVIRPSARRKPSWCTASQTKAKFRNSTYGTASVKRSTSTAAADPARTANAPQPHRWWSARRAGVKATMAR